MQTNVMKKLILVFAALSIVMTVSFGCISPSQTEVMSKDKVAEVMKRFPELESFCEMLEITNISTLRSDDDLEPVYSFLLANLACDFFPVILDLNRVNYFSFNDCVALVEGNIDADSLRRRLAEFGYSRHQSSNDSIEEWRDDFNTVLIMSGAVMFGSFSDVGSCKRVIESSESSLYDDKNAQALIERLPSGFVVSYANELDYWFVETGDYDGFVARAWSMTKKDKATIQSTEIYEFGNENAAENAIDQILNDTKQYRFPSAVVTPVRDGKYVEVASEIDISAFSLCEDKSSEILQEHREIQHALLAMMLDCRVTELDPSSIEQPNNFYRDVHSNKDIEGVTACDGDLSLKEYLPDDVLPLDWAWDIDIGGCVFPFPSNISDCYEETESTSERFTEFYVLGLDGTASSIPNELTMHEETNVIVGIVNHEGTQVHYKVEVTIDGFPTRFTSFYLEHEGKHEQQITLIPQHAGPNQKVEFTLVKDIEDSTTQTLHLWIDVSE